jgi:hypothetical protein
LIQRRRAQVRAWLRQVNFRPCREWPGSATVIGEQVHR